jgi:putative ABC transport system permease protein
MYPNLTPTLTVLLGIALALAAFIALRRPVLRRLALRQIGRRRNEAALVVAGSVLGTAIIIGSLVVGDTLNFSIKQAADDNLGPIDEYVSAQTVAQGNQAARRIEHLRGDPDIDGILSLRGDQAAVTHGARQARKAEPRANVWEVDFANAAAFGGLGGSGLTGPAPGPGEAVINQDLANTLGARQGDTLTVYLYGAAREVRVAGVVPTNGLAGAGAGDVARSLFFGPSVLVEAARSSGPRLSRGRSPSCPTPATWRAATVAATPSRPGSRPRSARSPPRASRSTSPSRACSTAPRGPATAWGRCS